jgi:hypothetical protein
VSLTDFRANRLGLACSRALGALALVWWLSVGSSLASAQEPAPTQPSPVDASAAPTVDAPTGQEPAAPSVGPLPVVPPDAGVAPLPLAPSAELAAPTIEAAKPAPAEPAAPTPQTKDEDSARAEPAEAIPGDPWGDGPGGITTGIMSFRALLQTRYSGTFARGSDNTRLGFALRENALVRGGDGWSLNRFFLRVGAEPTKHLSFRAIIDFAELMAGGGGGAVKQAYATLRPIPKHLEFHAGVFKLPFSIMELDPIAKYELSSLGPADDLIKSLGFGGRDVGADVMVAPLHKSKLLRMYVGAFRGQSHDEHAAVLGAVGGRLESKPVNGLRLGVDAVGQPYSLTYARPFDTSNKDTLPMPPDPLFPRAQHLASGAAYSADVTFARWRAMLRVEGMLGTRVDVDGRYGARNFWAAWGILAYRFRAGPVRLMPALRAEWLDADREHAVGLRRTLTAGVTCFFTKRVRLLLDVTRTDVEPGSPLAPQPLPLPGFPYFELSNTRLVGQLQVEI